MKRVFVILLFLSIKTVRSVDYPVGEQLRDGYYYKNLEYFKNFLNESNFAGAHILLDKTDFYPTWQDLRDCLQIAKTRCSHDEQLELATKIQQKSLQPADHLGIFLHVFAQNEELVTKYAKSKVGKSYIADQSLGFLIIVMPRMTGFTEEKKNILLKCGWGKKYTEGAL
jgi:hypothetical protein